MGGDNQLLIKLQTVNNHSTLSIHVSSVTLFILPVKIDQDITLLAQARRHGITVTAYQYEIHLTNVGPPALDLSLKTVRNAKVVLMSHLKADLVHQPLFPALRFVDCCQGYKDPRI